MTSFEVELLRRTFAAFTRDFDEMSRGALASVPEFFDENLEIENVDGWPSPGSFRGYAGFTRWFKQAFGGFWSYGVDDAQYSTVEGRVVVVAHSHREAPDGRAEAVPDVALVFDFHGSRIARVRVFLDGERALRAAHV